MRGRKMTAAAKPAAWLAVLGVAFAAVATGDEVYREAVQKWRQDREERLRAESGWLTLAGLFWLEDGTSTIGTDPASDVVLPEGAGASRAGVIVFEGGQATLRLDPGVGARASGQTLDGPRVMRSDESERPDVVELGPVSFYVIKRGDRYAVRVKDKNSRARREFAGLRWYEVNEGYRVEARWVSYPQPRPLQVPNVLGEIATMPSPGYAEFELGGRTVRLDGVLEDPTSLELFFILRDETSGKQTYGAGRFLYSDLPKQGLVVLDFNKAYNPPCAFTAYATCPLPPKQNWLPVPVEAGEMAYTGPGGH